MDDCNKFHWEIVNDIHHHNKVLFVLIHHGKINSRYSFVAEYFFLVAAFSHTQNELYFGELVNMYKYLADVMAKENNGPTGIKLRKREAKKLALFQKDMLFNCLP